MTLVYLRIPFSPHFTQPVWAWRLNRLHILTLTDAHIPRPHSGKLGILATWNAYPENEVYPQPEPPEYIAHAAMMIALSGLSPLDIRRNSAIVKLLKSPA